MNRDDRLFAIIGGTVVTAAATVFLVFAGGITGTIEDRPTVRVAPIPVADTPEEPSDIVPASFEEPMPLFGDNFVRAVVGGISTHPEWATWLVTDGLVQRFVAAVEAVADGYSPRGELGFVETRSPFLVREDEGRLVIAAGTYRRYDLPVEVFTSLDAEAAVVLFKELEPAIFEARRDVAWHRGDFDDRLRQAIDHLLEVEVPAGSIEVERRTLAYAFAEDDLERMSDAQRHLLRMGRKNAMAIQSKLREIRSAFGWPDAMPPSGLRHALASDEDADSMAPVLVAELDPGASLPEESASVAPMGAVVEPMVTPYDPRAFNLGHPLLMSMEEPMPMTAVTHP